MTSETNLPKPTDLRGQLLRECRAMARHAFSSGVKVPGEVAQVAASAGEGADQLSAGDLALLHGRLAEIVAPATPRAITFLDRAEAKSGFLAFLGPVRMVRSMMLVAFVCLVGFIGVSLSEHVDGKSISGGLDNSGIPLLLNELFFLAAAGLGASFAVLFKVSRYIVERTYDPTYETNYWVRFLLGLISGLILAQMIPLAFDGLVEGPDQTKGLLSHIGRPMLAMLGGFSADLVYRVLSRLIESVETLMRGDTKERVAAQEERAKAHFEQQSNAMRMDMATKLVGLQEQLSEGAKPDEVRQKLGRILAELIPGGAADDEPAPDRKLAPQSGKGGEAMGKDKPATVAARQTEGDGKSDKAKASEAAE